MVVQSRRKNRKGARDNNKTVIATVKVIEVNADSRLEKISVVIIAIIKTAKAISSGASKVKQKVKTTS